MKKLLLVLLITFTFSASAFSQTNGITSGQYSEMTLAYNPETKIITGFYNNGTGDDGHGVPQFSCMFYLEGKVINGKASIITYFLLLKLQGKTDDIIPGVLIYKSAKEIDVKLKEEHGGCWNVEHFADSLNHFFLDKKENWIAVKYAITDKAYFYQDDKTTRRKGYILKGDVVYIDSEKDAWAHCTYITVKWKRIAGWIKWADLNVLK